MIAGTKITRTTDEVKAKIVKYLLTYDADKLKRLKLSEVTAKVSHEFSSQVAESTVATLAKSLGIQLRGVRRNRSVERNTIGNARRVMFLAREVRKLYQSLGVEQSEMLNRLCGGLQIGESVDIDPT